MVLEQTNGQRLSFLWHLVLYFNLCSLVVICVHDDWSSLYIVYSFTSLPSNELFRWFSLTTSGCPFISGIIYPSAGKPRVHFRRSGYYMCVSSIWPWWKYWHEMGNIPELSFIHIYLIDGCMKMIKYQFWIPLILIFDFGNVPIVWYFVIFILVLL